MRASPYLLLVALGVGGLSSACVSSKVEQFRSAPRGVTPLVTGDTVVILNRRQHGDRQTEDSFNNCLESKLTSRQLPVTPQAQFVDALFPWLEPRAAPCRRGRCRNCSTNPALSTASARHGCAT